MLSESKLSLISRIESVAEHGGEKVTFVDGDDHHAHLGSAAPRPAP